MYSRAQGYPQNSSRGPNDPAKSARGRTVPNEKHGNGKGTGTTQEWEETAREREGNGSDAGRE